MNLPNKLTIFRTLLVPIMVIIDESASLKLFTASSITAIDPAIKPTVALNATRTTFTIIPSTLVLKIFADLSINPVFISQQLFENDC